MNILNEKFDIHKFFESTKTEISYNNFYVKSKIKFHKFNIAL